MPISSVALALPTTLSLVTLILRLLQVIERLNRLASDRAKRRA
jgi:hypothetical protein